MISLEFSLACLVMGLGIGLDVAIATAVRAGTLRQQRQVGLWIAGVTLTHTLFPMLGYLLTYFGTQWLPAITPLIGLLAFGLIAKFLWDELYGADDGEEHSQLLVTVGIILAVSWDALWSGPAKSAQVIGWPESWVWASFIVVGLVVMLFALSAYQLAQRLCAGFISRSQTIGQWLQYSLIAYFGLLALVRYTFDSDISEAFLLLLSLSVIALLLLWRAAQPQKPIAE